MRSEAISWSTERPLQGRLLSKCQSFIGILLSANFFYLIKALSICKPIQPHEDPTHTIQHYHLQETLLTFLQTTTTCDLSLLAHVGLHNSVLTPHPLSTLSRCRSTLMPIWRTCRPSRPVCPWIHASRPPVSDTMMEQISVDNIA